MLENMISMLYRPADPSLLAGFRICFGICMMLDIPQERGMSHADHIYTEDVDSYCTFPLIHGMKPFNQDIMILLYAVMFLNAFLITVGFFYRFNTIFFTIIYWYFFIIDKSNWNNHSYLYGLVAILLSMTNAHHYMSVDGMMNKNISNVDVPGWNYFLFRFQVFIVYFYAGIKKTESDWLSGYSMNRLSREWVFDPFRLFLTNDEIDYWVVHFFGFLFDISIGFFLYFDKTRLFGLCLCTSFHGLNSRMFNIGMFPYVMLVSSFIFCDPKCIKHIFSRFWSKSRPQPAYSNPDCIYEKSSKVTWINLSWKQVAVFFFAVFYISSQAFLPFSHSITKGYNGWTQGLYGYSWDMMVHSFSNQHVKIFYKNIDTGDVGYLKTGSFLSGKKTRWTTQPEMAYQYAKCIQQQLKKFGIENSSVHFDVWKSMNGRFQQRIFDPNIDVANVSWSPFTQPSFVMPLLSDLSNWREKLKEIKSTFRNISIDYDVVFVADFPGMYLENFVHEDFGDTVLEVLQGEVVIETENNNISLKIGEKRRIKPGVFHRIYTVSDLTSCYCYIYMNKTVQYLRNRLDEYDKLLSTTDDKDGDHMKFSSDFEPGITELYYKELNYKLLQKNSSMSKNLKKFIYKKISLFRRSFLLAMFSLRNIAVDKPTSTKQLYNEMIFLNLWSLNAQHTDTIRDSESTPVDRSNFNTEL